MLTEQRNKVAMDDATEEVAIMMWISYFLFGAMIVLMLCVLIALPTAADLRAHRANRWKERKP